MKQDSQAINDLMNEVIAMGQRLDRLEGKPAPRVPMEFWLCGATAYASEKWANNERPGYPTLHVREVL